MTDKYLSDEELFKLIESVEQSELVAAHPDLTKTVVERATASEHRKITQFSLRVVIASAAAVAALFLLPMLPKIDFRPEFAQKSDFEIEAENKETHEAKIPTKDELMSEYKTKSRDELLSECKPESRETVLQNNESGLVGGLIEKYEERKERLKNGRTESDTENESKE